MEKGHVWKESGGLRHSGEVGGSRHSLLLGNDKNNVIANKVSSYF